MNCAVLTAVVERNMNFFSLNGEPDDIDAKELVERLSNDPVLENFIYRPDFLKKDELGRLYKIKAKTFKNVSFSKTELREIEFYECIFEDCRFINSSLNECWFHNCRFVRTNPYKISFYDCYLPPKTFKDSLDKEEHQNIGVHLYQTLMRNARRMDQPEHEAEAHFEFLRWKRYQTRYDLKKLKAEKNEFCKGFKEKLKLRFQVVRSKFFEVFIGSGIRLRRYFMTAAGIVLFFFVINYNFQSLFGIQSDIEGPLECSQIFYYTVISLTTVGYGDITPTTAPGQFWISFQSVVGFVMFATLASMLYRKIAP